MGPDDHKVVGEFLAAIRRAANVTQDGLAELLGKPQSFVSSYERGQRRIDFLEFTVIVRTLGGDPEVEGAKLLAAAAATLRRKSRPKG